MACRPNLQPIFKREQKIKMVFIFLKFIIKGIRRGRREGGKGGGEEKEERANM